MITAIDTNVLLDILVPDPQYFDAAVVAIEASAERGSLVICDVVYAELCVHFASQADCDDFLTSNEIRVEALTRRRISRRAVCGGCTVRRAECGIGSCQIFSWERTRGFRPTG